MFIPAFLGQVRLAERRRTSQGRLWWMHHILNTRAYAETSFQNDLPGALKAVGELWRAVLDWQALTHSPVAGVLMGEHTVLVKLLVDCIALGKGNSCADTAVEALLRTVDESAQLFPRDPAGFAALFGPHTQLAGAYITDLANKDQESFQTHWAQALANGEALGRWTDEHFFVRT